MWPLPARTFFAAKRLAANVGIEETEILAVLSLGASQFYESWYKPKRDGGSRPIMAPLAALRGIQEKLLPVLYRVPASEIAHGFVPGRSLLTNALPHRQARSMLCLDIKDAFGSAWLARLLARNRRYGEPWPHPQFGVDLPVLEVIADLVDVNDGWRRYLAQGAPTSPHAFNCYCGFHLDRLLARLARNVGGTATRYADNVAFSMPAEEIDPKLRRAVWRSIEDAGFAVNPKKTCYLPRANVGARPLRLPGVNVIDGEIRLAPSTVRHYRIALFLAGKERDTHRYNGIKGHVTQVMGGFPAQLEGMYEKGLGF